MEQFQKTFSHLSTAIITTLLNMCAYILRGHTQERLRQVQVCIGDTNASHTCLKKISSERVTFCKLDIKDNHSRSAIF